MRITDQNQILPPRQPKYLNLISIGTFILFVAALFIGFDSDWIFFIFIGTILLISLVNPYVLRNRWQELGKRTGLTYQLQEKNAFWSWPKLTGSYRGSRFKIDILVIVYGRNNRRYFTRVNNWYNGATSETLLIKKRSIFHFTRTLTGDQDFDRKYTVNDAASPILRRILAVHNLRQGLMEISPLVKGLLIRISPVEIEYQEKGMLTDIDYLQAIMDWMIKFEKAFHHIP